MLTCMLLNPIFSESFSKLLSFYFIQPSPSAQRLIWWQDSLLCPDMWNVWFFSCVLCFGEAATFTSEFHFVFAHGIQLKSLIFDCNDEKLNTVIYEQSRAKTVRGLSRTIGHHSSIIHCSLEIGRQIPNVISASVNRPIFCKIHSTDVF